MGTREEIPEREPAGSGASRRPANCGYYLRQERDLIHRHVETIDLDLDDTARWRLRIDFELPTHPESYWKPLPQGGREEEAIFLFPIVFLEKSDVRTGFEVRQEDGTELTVPTREECNEISAQAAVQAAEALLAELDRPRPSLRTADLERIFRLIARWKPVDSAMVLEELQRQLGLDEPTGELGSNEDRNGEKGNGDPVAKLGRAWRREGLVDVLKMLVEHTLVWLPIRGRPGERRTIVLTQEKVLVRRSLLRWVVTDLRQTKYSGPKRWRERRREKARARPALELGDKRYGRRAYRISFSALAERIGRPLAWTPHEFQLPTIYTKRCRSYHFELTCPPGRTPRDLRVAKGTPLAEPSEGGSRDFDEQATGQTTLTSRRVRHDRPGNDLAGDLWFRVSVGSGDGAFPLLWPLAGMVTAIMLWMFAGDNPLLDASQAEIGTAILLAVPALIAALAFSGSEVPVSRLIGGAQMLLLIAGLSAVVAAAVVGGARPFELERDWIWSVCAMIATIATFPLVTAWLLSNPFVWTQMKRLRSRQRQKEALWVIVVLALLGIDVLVGLGSASLSDGVVAVYLLAVGVCATVLANNRAAMPIVENRKYVAFSFLIVAIVCLALACIEVRAAIDEGPGPQLGVELGAFAVALASLGAGNALSRLTELKWIKPRGGEIHVSPQVGRALLAKERVRELAILREREKQSGLVAHRGKAERRAHAIT